MNAFLEEMSKFYAGDEIILVMDGAGWHKAKNLQVPDNIEIIVFPPYSPERWSSGKILATHQAKYYQKSNLQKILLYLFTFLSSDRKWHDFYQMNLWYIKLCLNLNREKN